MEFIEDDWYILARRNKQFWADRRNPIPRDNDVGLGWWDPEDPSNPQKRPDPSESSGEESIEEDEPESD